MNSLLYIIFRVALLLCTLQQLLRYLFAFKRLLFLLFGQETENIFGIQWYLHISISFESLFRSFEQMFDEFSNYFMQWNEIYFARNEQQTHVQVNRPKIFYLSKVYLTHFVYIVRLLRIIRLWHFGNIIRYVFFYFYSIFFALMWVNLEAFVMIVKSLWVTICSFSLRSLRPECLFLLWSVYLQLNEIIWCWSIATWINSWNSFELIFHSIRFTFQAHFEIIFIHWVQLTGTSRWFSYVFYQWQRIS